MLSPPMQPAAEALSASAAGPDEAIPAGPFEMQPLMIDPLAEPDRFARVAAAAAMAAAREIGDFSAERLNAQAERIRAWAAARTPADWLTGEMSFAARSFASYVHEVAHLQDVMLEAAEAAAGEAS